MNSEQPSRQFYRKPLPSSCIAFASEEGKQIFREAMAENNMNCFFNLAAQFRTQEEPAYCGFSTLVMVLNALSVDPGRVWKGPWRWYHENMLDCCIPLSIAKTQGITLFQFCCLSRCNGLNADMVQVTELASIDEFRTMMKRIAKCDHEVLVSSYSRKTLGQSGDGHFSPLGGYHAGRDLVLIFDVARFKYPPHWVPVELLWTAMKGLDPATGQPRGYVVLKRTSNTGKPTVLFQISPNFNLGQISQQNPQMLEMFHNWWTWLATPCDRILKEKEYLQILVLKFLDLWCTDEFSECEQLFRMRVDGKCCGELSQQHKCAILELFDSLEKQPLFQIMEEALGSGKYDISNSCNSFVCWPSKKQQLSCPLKDNMSDSKFPEVKVSHFATMILLSWPYDSSCGTREDGDRKTHAALSLQYICQEMFKANNGLLQSEVGLLNAQLSTVFSYYQTVNASKSFTAFQTTQ